MPELHRRRPSPPNAATIAPPSIWEQFGSHRLRAPIGIVIDTPVPIIGGWVAAIWPDSTDPAGWRRLLWQRDEPTTRGWLIPERLAYADVVEFGSDPSGARRWYGLVEEYEPGQWLSLRGPFKNPPTLNEPPTRCSILRARLPSTRRLVRVERLLGDANPTVVDKIVRSSYC